MRLISVSVRWTLSTAPLCGARAVALAFVVLVSSLALLLVGLAPGDYASDLFGGIGADPALVAAARAREGLDRPLPAQYAAWLGRALRLDFGRSLVYSRPVGELVRQRAANTAVLAVDRAPHRHARRPAARRRAGGARGRRGAAAIRGASVFLLSAAAAAARAAAGLRGGPHRLAAGRRHDVGGGGRARGSGAGDRRLVAVGA